MSPSVKAKGCTRFWVEWQNGSDFFVNRERCKAIMAKKYENTQGYQLYIANQKICDQIYVHWLSAMEVLNYICV